MYTTVVYRTGIASGSREIQLACPAVHRPLPSIPWFIYLSIINITWTEAADDREGGGKNNFANPPLFFFPSLLLSLPPSLHGEVWIGSITFNPPLPTQHIKLIGPANYSFILFYCAPLPDHIVDTVLYVGSLIGRKREWGGKTAEVIWLGW
ncbi:hypothetical protein L873DRAFT_1362637 [Choiromyces venosus 120613-1]|uniref:Uncharacterized protein n=1 Tax=Choiromyces venosus 120613-1 TaxID=1336337 RepID=A0A3N4KF44_9PEZI|nr:hypothetical protein L873DRAFT_1362637 [Choiromyces venosus 120613-1]